MNKISICILIIIGFLSHYSIAQVEIHGTFDGSDGSHPQSRFDGRANINIGNINIGNKKPSNTYNRDRDSSSPSTSSNSQSSRSISSNNDYYERQRLERQRLEYERRENERRRRENETKLINEANKMISNDCIDIQRMQLVIDGFYELEKTSRLSYEGQEARAKLLCHQHNMESTYNKYSLMAMNIRGSSFSSINTRIMSLSYEDLDKYLKQFLNKHDFDNAKVEYQKYEKAKVLERETEELYAHLDDMNYLRENSSNIQKLKLIIEQQNALKYVSKYHLFLLKEIEKKVEFEEIRRIPLTVSNIKTILASKEATKNNANWKEISKGMTSQRLLSVLGTLNSDNNNILPEFVREEGGYYLFVGESTETDTKVVTKEYLVSKDGSEIEIYETEGVMANDIIEIKATLGDKKASAKLTSVGEVENKVGSTVANNTAGAKVTLMNTDWHKQNKTTVYSIDTDGTILQYGAESSVGLKANISGSVNADINVPVGETPIASANASVGAGIEAAHVGGTLAGKWTPKMIVNPDGSISYKQYSASVEGGLSAGVSAKVSASKKGVSVKVGAVSAGISFDSQDIDGALKQIDSDVALRIIKSSIDNGYYKSDFNDEAIGKAVVSGIIKEVEKY